MAQESRNSTFRNRWKVGANPIAGRGSVDLEGKFVHEGRGIICGDHLLLPTYLWHNHTQSPLSVSELDDYAFCIMPGGGELYCPLP